MIKLMRMVGVAICIMGLFTGCVSSADLGGAPEITMDSDYRDKIGEFCATLVSRDEKIYQAYEALPATELGENTPDTSTTGTDLDAFYQEHMANIMTKEAFDKMMGNRIMEVFPDEGEPERCDVQFLKSDIENPVTVEIRAAYKDDEKEYKQQLQFQLSGDMTMIENIQPIGGLQVRADEEGEWTDYSPVN